VANGISFDPERPLDRIQGETLRANAALRAYALMGPGRSLRKLAQNGSQQTGTKHLPSLERWSRQLGWVRRVEAWEQIQAEEDERLWAERRNEVRELGFQKGMALMELVDGILAEAPKFVRTTRHFDKANKREIVTMQLDLRVALRALREADRILRLSSEMETDRQSHELSGQLNLLKQVDLSALSDAELATLESILEKLAANDQSAGAGPGASGASET
jgi:hypothetical protein